MSIAFLQAAGAVSYICMFTNIRIHSAKIEIGISIVRKGTKCFSTYKLQLEANSEKISINLEPKLL